ncbi:MAG: hypothetical protein MZU97_18225 [Bacillus subtilis]|nr:hypothetical protein [Bacillus subtilis]
MTMHLWADRQGVRASSVMIGHVLTIHEFLPEPSRDLLDSRRDRRSGDDPAQRERVVLASGAQLRPRQLAQPVPMASPMILAKSCHDLDLMIWFADQRPKFVVLVWQTSPIFKAYNAPEGAPDYCMDGCPAKQETCPYYAPQSLHQRARLDAACREPTICPMRRCSNT